MRWVIRAGCAALAVGAMAGVARAYCEGPSKEQALAVVPAGGGVFVPEPWAPDWCRMMMAGGGRWVPLVRERQAEPGMVRYRPVRALVPGVGYEIVGVEPDGERVRYGRVVAGAAADRMAPRWRSAPMVIGSWHRAGCMADEARVKLSLDVEDESDVRVTIEARALDGGGEVVTAVVRPEMERAVMSWPLGRQGFLRAGVDYVARVCAEDVAGNRTCAQEPVGFTVPGRASEPMFEPMIPAWWVEPEPVVSAPQPLPEERMEKVAPGWRARVDWRCVGAGAAGALLVLAVAGLARMRRAARRRLSRTA